jgi:hypothetical protein
MRDRLCQKELDTERAPFIKQIFEKVAYEKQSMYQILRWLKTINFKTQGGKFLGQSGIQAILSRPFYYGSFEYPKGSGKWYKGKHKPIITKKLYEDARERLDQYNRRRHFTTSEKAPFAFLRMIRCGTCTSTISAEEKYKKLKRTGYLTTYRYYVCCRNRNRDCHERYISETQLMVELYKILDRVDIDLIGMKEYLELKIDKYYDFQSFVTGTPKPDRPPEQREYDLRKFAQVVFEDGSIDEKREILKHLKSRLILKDKKIYIDTLPDLPTPLRG